MDQMKLSRWLKIIIIGAGICGAIIYFYVFPFWGKDIIKANSQLKFWYWPWLIFLWATSVPCYAVLVCGWNIVCEIERDNSFCIRNSNLLRIISQLAAFNSAFFFTGNIIFLLLNMNHPGIVLLALFIAFIGIAISITAAALSHLVYKAAQIREENELTI